MRNKRKNRIYSSLLISTASMLLLTFVVLFFNFQFWLVSDNIGNLYVSFSDFSKTKENPSCRIILDDSIVYEIDKISTSKTKRFKLQNGKHKVEISDLNENYYLKESIFIKNYPEENNLYVSFEYNPSYEDYLPKFRKQYFDRFIEKHKNEYDKEQHSSIKEQINQQIDVEYLKRASYKPIERSFEITFYDEPIYLN
ncbi:hypothetical protein [Flavobacterium sp.]|uniref:hypothetical protein n=1 Tax=Flavobacterium sp. TaxID=239 RepID=UPI004047A663